MTAINLFVITHEDADDDRVHLKIKSVKTGDMLYEGLHLKDEFEFDNPIPMSMRAIFDLPLEHRELDADMDSDEAVFMAQLANMRNTQ